MQTVAAWRCFFHGVYNDPERFFFFLGRLVIKVRPEEDAVVKSAEVCHSQHVRTSTCPSRPRHGTVIVFGTLGDVVFARRDVRFMASFLRSVDLGWW